MKTLLDLLDGKQIGVMFCNGCVSLYDMKPTRQGKPVILLYAGNQQGAINYLRSKD